MNSEITIGCWAGFWGDSRSAAEQILRGAEIDYLVGDHLAEVTMALLARARAKDPAAGYIPDVVSALAPLLSELKERGIRVVTNGGALNPAGCAAALRTAAAEAGVELNVAAVLGDDVLDRADALRAGGAQDMFTGAPIGEAVLTMNAYLGARPIAAALGAGADIVVTGRCVDSAVVLGPLMHAFGWGDSDYDLLASGSLIGHIVECGPQALGGLFTDWADVPGWDDMGYPVAECRPDGSATITKPAGTGGLVSPATVAEQILYEIGDPGAYVLPDVVCDFREVRLEQDGVDRVCVSGARGRPPTATYKVTTTQLDGWRLVGTALFAGGDAGGRARKAGEAIVARGKRIAAQAGHADFPETSVEVVGAGDTVGHAGSVTPAREAVLKLAARHDERAPLEILANEVASLALVAQGMTGLIGGRPKPAPRIALRHVLVDKASVPVRVEMGGASIPVEVAPGSDAPVPRTPPIADDAGARANPGAVTLPLREIAYGRSGDKGNDANIGIIARRPELLPTIREQITTARVAEVFDAWLTGPVTRYELRGLDAINFVLGGVLGGAGGTSSLRYDPQGKSYAAILLDTPVEVDPELVRGG